MEKLVLPTIRLGSLHAEIRDDCFHWRTTFLGATHLQLPGKNAVGWHGAMVRCAQLVKTQSKRHFKEIVMDSKYVRTENPNHGGARPLSMVCKCFPMLSGWSQLPNVFLQNKMHDVIHLAK